MPERSLPLLAVAADAAAEGRPPVAGAGPRPRRSVFDKQREGAAARGAADYGADFGAGSCQMLLEELLAAIGRLETDFKLRWDAAELGVAG